MYKFRSVNTIVATGVFLFLCGLVNVLPMGAQQYLGTLTGEVTDASGAKIANADFSPQFPLRLMSKDMNLVAEAATELGAEMPAASATQKLFASQAAEHGDLDLSAIAALIAGRDLTTVG